MQKPLEGKLAIVTGASAGIGRATALVLARAGAEVIASARRAGALDRLVAEAREQGGLIRPFPGDMADRDFVCELGAAGDNVDILVSNAGTLTYAPLVDISPDESEAMFQLNVLATLHLCQLIGRRMLARKRGHMIVVTSGAAREVFPFGSVYAATKHALAALTASMRIEWEPHGVKVTEISPGTVETEIRTGITHPAVLDALGSRKFRPIMAEEVADTILYATTTSENAAVGLIDIRPRLRAE
jgi:NADP-dependent 3-hydroxy acid dehydrogenase YdfG